ncbi:MAG: endonuclease [Gammaproteobacteria bacterium]|nr:endonuclease [Gammaproteobacteria bacterium]
MKITSTLQLGALSLAIGLCSAAHAELIITEYVEGSSNNKAVELSNMGGEVLTLDGYVLKLYSNGATESKNKAVLSGVLAAGTSIVLYNSGAEDSFKKTAPMGMTSNVTWFNGDDALVLTFNGVVVDSFGVVGEDPGSAWTSGDFTTKERTLRRVASVVAGDTNVSDEFPEVSQWQVFPANTSDGIGCPGVAACDGSEKPTEPTVPTEPTEPTPTLDSPLIFSEYIEGGSYNKAIEIANTSDTSIKLAGFRVTLYKSGATEEHSHHDLTGSLAAKSVFVLYHGSANPEFKILAGAESTVTDFNGDDALLLSFNGAIVDVFGYIGEDPGKYWSDGEFNTKDKTLRRSVTVTNGDKNINDTFPGKGLSNWLVFDKDTSTGLGCYGEGECDAERIPPPTYDECTNCPSVDKIADASIYDENIYYTNAMVASSETLRNAIYSDISKDHKQLSYSEVWTVLTHSDEDPSDSTKVVLIYSGRSTGKGYNAGNVGNNADAWNREHVWAKSHGFPSSSQLGYTDAHHLRPADASMNSSRSNLDFDNGGEALAEAPENFKDSDSFEPRDEVKGDVARMMFYMDVRYEGATGEDTPDLVLVDTVGTKTSTLADGPAHFGKLCTLYAWHQADPVSNTETHRNNVVYEYQGNRNPFIDNPHWVQELFGKACGDAIVVEVNNPSVITMPVTDAVLPGSVVSINPVVTDEDDDTLTYLWSQTAGETVTFDATAETLSFTVPKTAKPGSISFTLTVSDGTDSTDSTTVVEILAVEKDSTGGSFGLLSILLATLVWTRRRHNIVL